MGKNKFLKLSLVLIINSFLMGYLTSCSKPEDGNMAIPIPAYRFKIFIYNFPKNVYKHPTKITIKPKDTKEFQPTYLTIFFDTEQGDSSTGVDVALFPYRDDNFERHKKDTQRHLYLEVEQDNKLLFKTNLILQAKELDRIWKFDAEQPIIDDEVKYLLSKSRPPHSPWSLTPYYVIFDLNNIK